MGKRKKDPSKAELGSPEVKGQGTTNLEIDGKMVSSARLKKKK